MSTTLTVKDRSAKAGPAIQMRQPRKEDATDVWRLISSCEPLDENSLYCNLLQCDHFAETCIVAERESDGAVVGWISAYLVPGSPGTVFVWQVAVDEAAQGQGIAKRMLRALLDRPACRKVTALETTITADNDASWALFRSLARASGGEFSHRPHFRRDRHFEGQHATEHLVTIRLSERLRAVA